MKISVVIPAFNAAKFIQRALMTVIEQSYSAAEIIIIDDGSIDDTKEKIFGIKDERIKYYYQVNAGPATARNNGILKASGDYIAFLDADDQWYPRHLEEGKLQLESMDNGTWVMCPYEVFEKSQIKKRMQFKYFGEIPFFELFKINAYIQTSGLIVRRDVLHEAGLFVNNWKFGEDLNLWFKIGLMHPLIGYTKEIGMQYNKTAGSLTFDKSNYNLYNSLKVIENSINFFRKLPNVNALPILRRWILGLVLDAALENKKNILSYSSRKWSDIVNMPISLCTIVFIHTPKIIRYFLVHKIKIVVKLTRKILELAR